MQTGEGVHRRRGGLRGAFARGAFLALLPIAAGPAGANDCAARMLAGCPRGCASGNAFHGVGALARARAGFHAIASNPYLLDGLVSSDLLLGVEGRSFAAWIDWRHLGYALYREDGFTAAIGISSIARVPVRLYAVPAIERRAPRGFGASVTPSLSFGGSFDIGGAVCAGCVIRAAGGDGQRRGEGRVFLQIDTGTFALVVDGALSGPRGRDAQCLIDAWLANGCAIACSYRWKTGELTSGFVIRISRTILDFSWSRSPALGNTVTAGAGMVWEW